MIDGGALVLFSGGQDSATCLAWALDRFPHVETLGFDYGQRHLVELACRAGLREGLAQMNAGWKARLGEDHTVSLPFVPELSQTALTSLAVIEMTAAGLPNTFVPGRNLLFLIVAGALAYRRGLKHLVGGMCETDYSGYPDCRDDAVKAQQIALSVGMAKPFAIHTPLMWLDKSATWELAKSLGGPELVSLIIDETHTCYLGERQQKNDWGYGCGECPACALRSDGYSRWRSTTGR